MLKVVTIVGARPQFIKAAPMHRALRSAGHLEILVHTGQHYDVKMSDVFFEDLGIPAPNINLAIGSRSHGAQTGTMLARIEEVLIEERPDWVLVYGDTNSTLAGALAAAKLNIKVAHVEAGLRSYNRLMPEEINRVVVDHVSTLLFCPSQTASGNLAKEGITRGVHIVGDVMAEALDNASAKARQRSQILPKVGVEPGKFILATVHRAENTDDAAALQNILAGLAMIGEPVIFPVHPRTRKKIIELGYSGRGSEIIGSVKFIEPVGFLDMVMLEQSARLILTDSGGVQKEAYWLGIPCVTLRKETEWVETVDAGWNMLVGADSARIAEAAKAFSAPTSRPSLYGDGNASARCVDLLSSNG